MDASDRTIETSNGHHHLDAETVLALVRSGEEGLAGAEVLARQAAFGPNRLPEGRRISGIEVFLHQFRSPFIYLLLAAAAVSIALGHATDAVFIVIVLLSNAAIGTYQEWRAEERAQALKSLIRVLVSVRRDGAFVRLPSEELVPGDIVRLASGEKVAADIRLLETTNLTVDESVLTGESLVVRKHASYAVAEDAPLGDRTTMLHAGTTVQTGRALGVVVATGRDTVVGRLASALEKPQQDPPLVRRMEVFTRHVAVGTMALIALIALLEYWRGADLGEIVLIAVALAVSAIPEGLPVAMTVALSIAMQRMGRRNVVVRHMPAVEGLGACTLIATDKTGTLTLNRLTVDRVWLPGRGLLGVDADEALPLLVAAARASEPATAGAGEVGGDAVDIAFLDAASDREEPAASGPVLAARVPYEPEKRYAAAFHDHGGRLVVSVKGAPETVLALCDAPPPDALNAAQRMSADGYRVIAVAAGRVDEAAEHRILGLTLIGFAGLIDPLRPEAADAVAAAQRAGVRVVMVTGDHPLTALAIARGLGLAEDLGEVTTGADLARMTSVDFDRAVSRARVFARTEPLQKLAIVDSLRRQGHVVAVTGDGINDAAALHAADIGVAMGKGGTDVARDAADLILTDDNFASIVAGIEEGRVAYDNLRKVIQLLISTGAAEILIMLLASIFGLPPPLTAVQLLWLNLVTNGMQDVALAFEKGEPDVLARRPRPADAPVFDRAMITQVALSGATIGLIGFLFYAWALDAGWTLTAAQGAVLWLLVWCENAHVFNSRSERRSVFRTPLSGNWLLIGAVAGTQVLQLAVLYIPPLRDLLSMEEATAAEGLWLVVPALGVVVVMEAYKALMRRRERPDQTT